MEHEAPPVTDGLRESLYETIQSDDVDLCFAEERIGLVLTGIDAHGNESEHPDAPCAFVEVSGVAPDSPAAAHPALRRGHMLKSIQGQNVVGLSFNSTVEVLAASDRPVTITVGRPPDPQQIPQPAQMPQHHQSALEEQIAKLAAELQRERDISSKMQQQLDAQAAETAAAVAAAEAAHAAVRLDAQRRLEEDDRADEATRIEAQRRQEDQDMASVARAELAAAMQAEAAAEHERSRRQVEEHAAAEAQHHELELREERAAQRRREEGSKYISEVVAARRTAAETLAREALADVQRAGADDERRITEVTARLAAIGADTLKAQDKLGDVTRIGEFPPPIEGEQASGADFARPHRCIVATAVKAILVGASGVDSGSVVGVYGHDGCGKTTLLHEIANNSTVQAAFPDGIYMLRLGSDPDPGSLQATLLQLLGDPTPFHSEAKAVDLLIQNFHELRALVIIDDVVAAGDVRVFVTAFTSCNGCRLLLAAPTQQVLSETAVVPECVFGVRPAEPELLVKILEGNSSWQGNLTSDGSADERIRCLELGRASKGVKLVIQTLAAHIAAGVDTQTLCQQVQSASALRTERLVKQWEREAWEQFDRGEIPTVDEPPAMPDSDDDVIHGDTPTEAPLMPLNDSDDETEPPPLPQHSSDEENEVHLNTRVAAIPEPGPEPEHITIPQARQHTVAVQLPCRFSDRERCVSQLLLQGSFDVLSACFITLDETVQRRCVELAAFPSAVPVPLIMMHRVWNKHGMDSFACEHLLQHLGRRGWLQRCCLQGNQTYAIVIHPIISDFLVVWWRLNYGSQGSDAPDVVGHRHLVREWAGAREPVGWGVDGGYWLRHMLRHFRGAGLQFRRFAMCSMFSIQWLECKIALCQTMAATKDLGTALDSQGYGWKSLLYNSIMLEACGVVIYTPEGIDGEPQPAAIPGPASVPEREPEDIKDEAYALFRRLLPDSHIKTPFGDGSGIRVEDSHDHSSYLPYAPESDWYLSEAAIPSDDDVDRVRRCLRDCMSLLTRWPGSLRQQLVMHLQRAGEEGGISIPIQRFLRSVVNDPSRSSTEDTKLYNFLGILAEWNCGNQSWQSSPAIFGQYIQREGMLSEISEQQVLCVDIDRVGKLVASCCADGSVSIWDMRGAEPLSKHELRFEAGSGKIASLVLNSEGNRMATQAADTVCVYDVSLPCAPKLLHQLPRTSHTSIITSVAISDDGHRVATSCGDSVVRVFDIGASGVAVAELRNHTEWVAGVSMACGGNLLVSWGSHEVFVWSSGRSVDSLGSVPARAPLVRRTESSEHSSSAPDVTPVSPPQNPSNRADQERWIDQVMSAATPVPKSVAQSAPNTTDEGVVASSIGECSEAHFTRNAALSLQTLAVQGGCDTGIVVEQVELGKDGSWMVLRYRSEEESEGVGSYKSGFAIWRVGAPTPMHIMDGLESRLNDVRIADQFVLSCSDDGELLLWEWSEAGITVISRWAARTGALNACALSWKGKVAVCGLAGGLTALLARQVSQWDSLPGFLGIPKMAPDDWEICCQVSHTPFTRWTRKHHCRRCGRLICNAASVVGAPKSQQERENAIRQIRKTKATQLTLRTSPEFSTQSSDEDEAEMAVESEAQSESPAEPQLSDQLIRNAADSAEWLAGRPLEERLVELKLARLRRCTECVEVDIA